MAKTLRKMAPWLVLAGVALLPTRAGPRRKSAEAPPQTPAAALNDKPTPERNAKQPAEMFDPARGRLADAPHEIPARGWKDILIRTGKEFSDDQIPLVAAGMTFYALLALFPALACFVALYGLVADITLAQTHLEALAVLVPREMLQYLGEQMLRLSQASEGGLTLAVAGGLALSVWSANGGMKAMITALNIAYDETEKRGIVHRTLLSLAFTLGLMLFGLGALTVIAAPPAIERLAGPEAALVFRWSTWPALLAAMGGGLAMLYRFGPSREQARWRWISWGSVVALVLWVAASAAFSVYVANFAHYERTYGSLGAVIGLMMWIYVSGQVVLLGAELNSEIEHQTARDTTTGAELPLGVRGAVMADTVGAKQGR